jgi:hypothetical protein
LAPEGMNPIVFGREGGKDQKTTAIQKVCLPGIFTCSHITFAMVILFIFCLLAPEGMNSIVFGEIKGDMSEVYYLLGRYTIQKKKMIYRHNIIVNLSYTMIAGDTILSA